MKEPLTFLLLFSYLLSTAQDIFINLDDQSGNTFDQLLDAHRVIAIGEIHGAAEVPELVLELAQAAYAKDSNVTVALEISSDFQEDIDAFMIHGQTERLKSVGHFQYPDGRSSLAMVRLLEGLRELKGIHVACFDVPWGQTRAGTRDSTMGANLNRWYKGQQMIILTGNLHAVLDLESMRPGYKSAVYHFKEMSSLTNEVLALNTYFGGGTTWHCQREGCDVYPAGKVTVISNNDLSNFIRYDASKVAKGYHGFIYFDKVEASLPFGSALLELYDLVAEFKRAILEKDSTSFKKLFFKDPVPFIGKMSETSEASMQKDYPEFQGLAVSNSSQFIRDICESTNSQEEKTYNIEIKTNGAIATIHFDYAFYSAEKAIQWGNENWNVVLVENEWLITDVIYSIHLPDEEPLPDFEK